MDQSLFELNVDTQILFDRLSTMKKGDFIAYETLTDLIKKNVQIEGYRYLYTARNMMRKMHGIVIDVIENEGLRALTDEENIALTGKRALKGIRNKAKLAASKITKIDDFSKLSDESKIKHNAHLGIFQIFIANTSKKRIEKVENKVAETGEKLPMNGILELFK